MHAPKFLQLLREVEAILAAANKIESLEQNEREITARIKMKNVEEQRATERLSSVLADLSKAEIAAAQLRDDAQAEAHAVVQNAQTVATEMLDRMKALELESNQKIQNTEHERVKLVQEAQAAKTEAMDAQVRLDKIRQSIANLARG